MYTHATAPTASIKRAINVMCTQNSPVFSVHIPYEFIECAAHVR